MTATIAPMRETLGARCRAALRRAAASRPLARKPYLVSVGLALPTGDPLDLFARAADLAPDRFYWERPSDGVAFTGLGAAWRVEAGAPPAMARAWRALLDDATVDLPPSEMGANAPMAGPLLVGGFTFDAARPATGLWEGYPRGLLVLPRVTLVTTGQGSILTINALVGDGAEHNVAGLLCYVEDVLAHPSMRGEPLDCATYLGVQVEDLRPRAEWEALVASAARTCRDGVLDKVVLARAVRARATRGFDVATALRYARQTYPNAYTFAVARGERVFIGATPERLVRLRDGVADVACLAGSTRRGATVEEDSALGAALLESPKDRMEHAVVVDAVRDALGHLCVDVRIPSEPRLRRLPNVQHLYTPVTGGVADGITALDLVERLHPTPAVGGRPRAAALEYIRAHEGLDRGWYAAPVGWLDRAGAGEFVVALRSALVRGDEATLFAGCGIVAASAPAAEYQETLLKLRPMLAALGAHWGGA